MCNHSLAEKDTEIADGSCAICLFIDNKRSKDFIQFLYDEGQGGNLRPLIQSILVGDGG